MFKGSEVTGTGSSKLTPLLCRIRRNYLIEVFFTFVWSLTPILVTVTAFLHYVLVAKKPLNPSIAFTAVAVFSELRFALK